MLIILWKYKIRTDKHILIMMFVMKIHSKYAMEITKKNETQNIKKI